VEKIQIKKNFTVIDLERLIKQAQNGTDDAVTVTLPRAIPPKPFLESRIMALLGGVSKRATLTVVDPWKISTEVSRNVRFRYRLDGIASLHYADNIIFPSSVDSLTDRNCLLSDMVRRCGGVVEPDKEVAAWLALASLAGEERMTFRRRSQAISFCTLDTGGVPELSEYPRALSGSLARDEQRQEFLKRINGFRDMYLNVEPDTGGTAHGRSPASLTGDINEVNKFIYELYENGYTHGAKDMAGNTVHGIRHLAMNRLFGDHAFFEDASTGVPALKTYLNRIFNQRGEYQQNFLEVTIGDNGPGIIRTLTEPSPGRHPRFPADTPAVKVLEAVAQGKVTSTNKPGAGWGISRVIDATKALDGFLSIRTNSAWVYYEKSSEEDGKLSVVMPSEELGEISGTHVSVFFPVRMGAKRGRK
jgi:hypothetical protein